MSKMNISETILSYWADKLAIMEECVILLSDMWQFLPKLVQIIERVHQKALFATGIKKESVLDVTDINLPFVLISDTSKEAKVTGQKQVGLYSTYLVNINMISFVQM